MRSWLDWDGSRNQREDAGDCGREDEGADVSGAVVSAGEVLGGAGMRVAAAVRRGGGRGDDVARHLSARAGAEAGADCLCAAEPPAGGRALWGEPEPAVPAYAASGDSETTAGAD